MQLRSGAVAASISLSVRHRERFEKNLQFALSSTLDSEAARHHRIDMQRQFFLKPPCCIGYFMADLRELMTPSNVDGDGGLGRVLG